MYGSDESMWSVDGFAVAAAGVEGCGSSVSAVKCRDSSALTFTILVIELSNVLAVVGTVSYRAVYYWLGRVEVGCWRSCVEVAWTVRSAGRVKYFYFYCSSAMVTVLCSCVRFFWT